MAQLFFDLHSEQICYVVESKSWYAYDGRRWVKDEAKLVVMERCKDFVQALIKFAKSKDDESQEAKAFIKYASGFHGRTRREGLLSDARSVAPMSLAVFDANRYLLNCQNGTLDLKSFTLKPHCAGDYITKMARVKYDISTKCSRWDLFISEVMCGDSEMVNFLQKALGYALTGDTSLECFFILYGSTTRNGKTTDGLQSPQRVIDATKAYRQEADTMHILFAEDDTIIACFTHFLLS